MPRTLAIFLLFLLTAPAGAAPAFADPDADVRAVFQLLQDRLQLMQDVAAWKHARKAPVVDAEREQQVLEATVQQASELGIDAASARRLSELAANNWTAQRARAQQDALKATAAIATHTRRRLTASPAWPPARA